jgi:xanthine dehydrogenase accessory factor
MTDLASILALSRELEAGGSDYVLASVIAVESSSYRKPGALMLLTADGRRVGTISGGCLEAEVASRAMWLTANGPTIQRYSTAEDDGDRPYGSGCGGVVHLLLERRGTAAPLIAALDHAFAARIPIAVATILEGHHLGMRAFASSTPRVGSTSQDAFPHADALHALAGHALATHQSHETTISLGSEHVRVRTDYRPARPAVAIFGAGDDAQPLMRLACELGWFVSVADGRSHLATRDRFRLADKVHVLPIRDLVDREHPGTDAAASHEPFRHLQMGDAAVVMTHSFDQDSAILASLLALDTPPAYIGVLGPQRRTRELLAEAARILHLPLGAVSAQAERWLGKVHAPTGLDLGADSPETIALSILAEIQKFRTAATALPLKLVRAATEAVTR